MQLDAGRKQIFVSTLPQTPLLPTPNRNEKTVLFANKKTNKNIIPKQQHPFPSPLKKSWQHARESNPTFQKMDKRCKTSFTITTELSFLVATRKVG